MISLPDDVRILRLITKSDPAWAEAHQALLQGRWVEARAALDELLQHSDDARDFLPQLAALPHQPAEWYREVLEDRLREWNAAVERGLR